ncbi:hypothetical protein, variant [Microbotryum lychnidis-dioicae p1A1 Lamole]|uniref:AB hydrolase-1 domain-containing protein n=1 Tax=Microbotryum lychnidis-dioicae (strain p1A1 Lamole / MvSl-1064) TaxID=683840 RepID=U5H9F5_USTV1|nr:hypothetical protein MVLG_03846 [Microbotryum lychnidis-dioicae p1A1 Lamole]KDE05755.1 hypothetical protein, variant [Microbotryum lychnidis-dioicae p1A1 Lamole]|eukprot:KDE05754.1 hypothetical protein MVLG_03846 [Microbotryum lychnidis-dioicae p1A1 Lamole]
MPYVTLPGSIELYWEAYGPRRDKLDPSGPDTKWAEPESPSTSTSTSYRSIELKPDGSLDLRTDVPTLIVLAPIWLDLSYCQSLFDRFAPQYQIVALENRSHGRSTRSPVMPSFDFFVSAADVAFAMEALSIPPSHVFCSGALAFQVGLKLCLLFPNQVLSLALVGAGQLFAPPDHVEVFEELDQCWFFPVDEGDYYETLEAISEIFLSDYNHREDSASIELKDRIVNTFIRRYNPYRLPSALEVTRPNHRHPCLGTEDLSGVKQPVMLLHGGLDKCYSPDTVRGEVPAWLQSSKEVDWHVIEGAPHLLALTHPELVNDYWAKFLARHSVLNSTWIPLDRDYALQVLAGLARHTNGEIAPEDILQRSGDDPHDFSLVTPLEVDLTRAQIVKFSQYGAEVCRLQFPGRYTADPWDVSVRTKKGRSFSQEEWTISRRHVLDDRFQAPRKPMNPQGISVSVLADRF